MFFRRTVYYCEHSRTGKQESLGTTGNYRRGPPVESEMHHTITYAGGRSPLPLSKDGQSDERWTKKHTEQRGAFAPQHLHAASMRRGSEAIKAVWWTITNGDVA